MTVFVDLIAAVGLGIVLCSLVFVKEMADRSLESCLIIDSETSAREAGLDPKAVKALGACKGKAAVYRLEVCL